MAKARKMPEKRMMDMTEDLAVDMISEAMDNCMEEELNGMEQ